MHIDAPLSVAPELKSFVENELLVDLPIETGDFWAGLADLIQTFQSTNQKLLEERETLQSQIDEWVQAHAGRPISNKAQTEFLQEIAYLVPRPKSVTVETQGVDAEIGKIAGPQLVVPITNARYCLNAANARWGSLYDALYGTDALGSRPVSSDFDPVRGAQVVDWVSEFLDDVCPLSGRRHSDVEEYKRLDNQLFAIVDGQKTPLSDPNSFAGYLEQQETQSYFLKNNRLHIELIINPKHPIGKTRRSGLCDVVLESTPTAIHDCEDSVAAVDAEDKVTAYRNWLGLMRGDLTAEFTKAGRAVKRTLNNDREICSPEGSAKTLSGRSLALVRNVGHLMTTDAVTVDGQNIPEGLLDALITVTAALHDLRKTEGPRNSKEGSVYVVKPKMHGPTEVAFANAIFDKVEDILGLPRNTVKIGVMDEERRTSVNLDACIHEVKNRIVFINTGFLDRTGDEIHTWMKAGPVLPKDEMKSSSWLSAYETRNVAYGIQSGLVNKGQVGKGMWAKPDEMAEMLRDKVEHPKSGANTAWVPSPTAAILHATHYHKINVEDWQAELRVDPQGLLNELLTPPLLNRTLTDDELRHHLDNNCQSILGYVVRWIDQGVGCSKVPDINDIGLMEDRATLRISSQLLANWLHHGLITEAEVVDSLERMALKVDQQNRGDPMYLSMAPSYSGNAFKAAKFLILEGAYQPSGYTEPLLHTFRKQQKKGA